MHEHCDGDLRACRSKSNRGISLAGAAVRDLAREVQRGLNHVENYEQSVHLSAA